MTADLCGIFIASLTKQQRSGARMRPWHLLVGCLPVLSAPVASAAALDKGGTLPCSYFVAAMGSDRNDGESAARPFATLEKAQAAVRRSRSKVVCLRGGIYRRTVSLTLSREDSGETWQYYAPDGVNSAILDGGGTLSPIIEVRAGTSNLTINGLKLQNFGAIGIDLNGGGAAPISHFTIANSDIGFGGSGVRDKPSAAIGTGNTPNLTVAHNYIHDMQGAGVAIYAWKNGDILTGVVVDSNVVLRTNLSQYDSGAIYFEMPNDFVAPPHSIFVTNNFIRDTGQRADHVHGIYLDQWTNHVTVSGNIIGPPNARGGSNMNDTSSYFVNTGWDNAFSGNIIDLGASAKMTAAIWAYNKYGGPSSLAGNSFTGNIVIGGFTGDQTNNVSGDTGHTFVQGLAVVDRSWFNIRDNLYKNYAGGKEVTAGNQVSDAAPIHKDPKLSGLTYLIAPESPALKGPIRLPPIVGGWGPPGFTIPPGTPPSSPH